MSTQLKEISNRTPKYYADKWPLTLKTTFPSFPLQLHVPMGVNCDQKDKNRSRTDSSTYLKGRRHAFHLPFTPSSPEDRYDGKSWGPHLRSPDILWTAE